MNPLKQVDILIKRYPELAYQRDNIIAAYNIMEKSYNNEKFNGVKEYGSYSRNL